MQVNIGEILSGHRRSVVIDCNISLDDINLNEYNVNFLCPPYVKGKILMTNSELVFSGEINAKISEPCALCQEQVELDIDTDFEVHLTDNEESDIMEYDTYVYEGEIVDITNLVAIEVADQIPIKVLCSDDCQGLCPGCGVNLNYQECICQDDDNVIDIRLQKLKELLK